MNNTPAFDWRKDWLAWLMLATVVIGLSGITTMAFNIGRPFGGFIAYNRAQAPHNEIDGNTPIWWSGLIGDRLLINDLLLDANGRPFYAEAQAVFAAAAAAGQNTVDLLVQRTGLETPVPVAVNVESFTLTDFLDARLPDLITATTYWLLAFIVYRARPNSPLNRTFALVTAIVALTRSLYVHTVFFGDNILTATFDILLLGSAAFVGVLLLRFAFEFPEPVQPRWRLLTPLFMIMAVAAATCLTLSRLPNLPGPPWPENLQLYRAGEALMLFSLLISFLALIGRTFWHLVNGRSSQRRRRVLLIVLGGLFATLPFILVSTLGPYLLDDSVSSYFYRGLDLRYLLLGVPVAFAYVLVRYHAMQSPSDIFVYVMALALSALLAAIGAWFWTLVHPNWPGDGTRPPFAALFFITFIASLFWSTQTRWQGLFARTFEWERHSYGASRTFGRRLMGQTDLQVLPQTISDSLVEEMALERAAVWLTKDGELCLEAESQKGGQATEPVPAAIPIPDDVGHDTPGTIRLDPPDNIPLWLNSLDQLRLEVAVPLIVDDNLVGLLALGRRWDESIFDERDLEVAEMVGQQAALHLLAAQSIDELRLVPGRLVDVQERERLLLAEEIHDTVQQLLGRLPFFLSISRDMMVSNPHKSAEILEQTITDVEEVAVSVRQIRHNLAPSQLESGLEKPLKALTTRFYHRAGIPADLTLFPELDASTTLETRHVLYRVIQQALHNVEEHATATQVTVNLRNGDGKVHVLIEDDGRGSSEEERAKARQQGSFGLQSMQARLESVGGSFELCAAPGEGTTIIGWLPIPKSLN